MWRKQPKPLLRYYNTTKRPTKAHQTTPTRKPSATAAQVGQAAGTGLKDATKVTAASVSAKLDAAKPSGPLGLTPGDIRAAQTDPRNQRDAIPSRAPRSDGLRIPSEADVQAQQELRAAMTGVPATGPYSLDAAQMAAAAQVAAAHAATLTVVKRMSAA